MGSTSAGVHLQWVPWIMLCGKVLSVQGAWKGQRDLLLAQGPVCQIVGGTCATRVV